MLPINIIYDHQYWEILQDDVHTSAPVTAWRVVSLIPIGTIKDRTHFWEQRISSILGKCSLK
jgi:hypothetical protein